MCDKLYFGCTATQMEQALPNLKLGKHVNKDGAELVLKLAGKPRMANTAQWAKAQVKNYT